MPPTNMTSTDNLGDTLGIKSDTTFGILTALFAGPFAAFMVRAASDLSTYSRVLEEKSSMQFRGDTPGFSDPVEDVIASVTGYLKASKFARPQGVKPRGTSGEETDSGTVETYLKDNSLLSASWKSLKTVLSLGTNILSQHYPAQVLGGGVMFIIGGIGMVSADRDLLPAAAAVAAQGAQSVSSGIEVLTAIQRGERDGLNFNHNVRLLVKHALENGVQIQYDSVPAAKAAARAAAEEHARKEGKNQAGITADGDAAANAQMNTTYIRPFVDPEHPSNDDITVIRSLVLAASIDNDFRLASGANMLSINGTDVQTKWITWFFNPELKLEPEGINNQVIALWSAARAFLHLQERTSDHDVATIQDPAIKAELANLHVHVAALQALLDGKNGVDSVLGNNATLLDAVVALEVTTGQLIANGDLYSKQADFETRATNVTQQFQQVNQQLVDLGNGLAKANDATQQEAGARKEQARAAKEHVEQSMREISNEAEQAKGALGEVSTRVTRIEEIEPVKTALAAALAPG